MESEEKTRLKYQTRTGLSRLLSRELYYEAKEGNCKEVEDLIKNGADVNSQVGDNGLGPLHVASQLGYTDVVNQLLISNADVNLTNQAGQTPLHLAKNEDIAKLLINHKADVNSLDDMSRTPLHMVADADVASVLIQAGTNVNILDKKIRNPLHYTHDRDVVEVMCKAGADVNLADENKRTPLHEAAWYNRTDAVLALLNAGCRSDLQDSFGITPLGIAKGKCSLQVVDILEKYEDTKVKEIPGNQAWAGIIPREILRMDDRSVELYKLALRSGKEQVFHIRLMVVGPFGVGKTSLINRLLQLGYDLVAIESTNGVDIHVRKCAVLVPDGQWVLFGDHMGNLNNYELRLGKVLTSYKPPDPLSTSDLETNEEQAQTNGEQAQSQFRRLESKQPELEKQKEATSDCKILYEIPEMSTDAVDGVSEIKRRLDSGDKTETLRRIVDALKNEDPNKKFGEISVWDFGGQFIYYSTHQTFLSPRAVYVVVMDISKALDETLEIDDGCFIDTSAVQYLKMGEYILFWLNSIHTYGSDEDDGVPPVIFVATHLDQLQEDADSKVKEFFDNLRESLMDEHMPLYMHLADQDFALDNTKPNDEVTLTDLKAKIYEVASKQRYWGEEVPALWISLEKSLMEMQRNGTQVLSFSNVMDINSKLDVPISKTEEIDLFLRFQHSLGNIIFFTDLPEFIILNPQWLVDAFKCLIKAEIFCERNIAIRSKWLEFSKTAILREDLIDAVWKHKESSQFFQYKDHLLRLMEKLDIISKPRIYAEVPEEGEEIMDYYLVPCMLKPHITDEKFSELTRKGTSTPYLHYSFDFLPPAVFHRLLAACLKKWNVAFDKQSTSKKNKNRILLSCGYGIFDVNPSTRLSIRIRNNRISIQVHRYHHRNISPENLVCAAVREFVAETLRKIFDRYEQNLPFKLQIPCGMSPALEDIALDVDDLKNHLDVICSCDKGPHSVHSVDLLKYWYIPEDLRHLCAGSEEFNSRLPFGTVYERPSEHVLGRLARRIGVEYRQLGITLGLTAAEIEQIDMDNQTTPDRCFKMLRKCSENATLLKLEKAFVEVGIDRTILYESIASA